LEKSFLPEFKPPQMENENRPVIFPNRPTGLGNKVKPLKNKSPLRKPLFREGFNNGGKNLERPRNNLNKPTFPKRKV